MSSPCLTIMLPPDDVDELRSPSPPKIVKSVKMEEFSETDESDSDDGESEKETETETCWTMFIKLFTPLKI